MTEGLSKEEILAFMRHRTYKPMTADELLHALNMTTVDEIKTFLTMLRELELDGEVYLTKKLRYGLPEKMNLISGKVQGNPRGYAFVIPDDKSMEDIYINADHMCGAMHNDRVMVRVNRLTAASGKGPEGEIVKVLIHANATIVGKLEKNSNFAFAVPVDPKISKDVFIPKLAKGEARNGDLVVVEISKWPEKRRNPEGRIIEVIGGSDDPGVDILTIIKKHELPEAFSQKVLLEAQKLPDAVTDDELKGRRDYRQQLIITVDGDDAKDFDDAVGLQVLANGNWQLGVHIADVSHYVKEDSPLDKEARSRGCSVYLVDRVIPMLPVRLSNNICSLNPHVDRLTMSCVMEIDHDGQVVNYTITPSVINSHERMTYDNVYKLLEGQDNDEGLEELRRRYDYLIPLLTKMKELCLLLRRKRFERGAIDFQIPEAKIILDESGKPQDIQVREHNIAEQIIEEFMILTNETVAQHFYWLEVPFLYRVHEDPDEEKVISLNSFLYNYGLSVKGVEKVRPAEFQRILKTVKGQKEERIISTVMLRSMKQAHYEAEHPGHFGLALEYYSHFTSPIRRYPDLMIHRIIREYLKHNSLSEKRCKQLQAMLPEIAEISSNCERAAMEAEMETDELKMAEFMQDKIGEVFRGFISGVTSFGFFVELPNTVEGLVRITTLNDDYYLYNEEGYQLLGEHTGKCYRLGDEISVQLVRVSVEARQIDFEVAEDTDDEEN